MAVLDAALFYGLQKKHWPHQWVGAQAASGPCANIPCMGHIVEYVACNPTSYSTDACSYKDEHLSVQIPAIPTALSNLPQTCLGSCVV